MPYARDSTSIYRGKNGLIFALISAISGFKCPWLTPLGVYSAPPTPSCLLRCLAHPAGGLQSAPRPPAACCAAWLIPLGVYSAPPDPQLLAALLGSPRWGFTARPPTPSCLLRCLAHPAGGLQCAPRPPAACCTAWLTPLGVYSAPPDPQLLAALLAAASRFPFHHQLYKQIITCCHP